MFEIRATLMRATFVMEKFVRGPLHDHSVFLNMVPWMTMKCT